MDNIIRILNVFYLASGLKINISKSNLYGVGVSSDDIESMAAGTGCSASNLPFSYLGLPIGSNMNRIANWNSLIERFKIRLSGWKANMLSSGGRLTLIKSVLGSLGIYYFSIFKVPEAVLKTLESLRASFFWGATGDTRKLAWIKWSNILASLDKGGLGGLKSIHGNEAGIELKGCQPNGLWAHIVGTIYHLHSSGYVPLNSLRYQVGDGSMIRFWKDTWLDDAHLCSRFNRALADLNNLLMDIGSLNVEVDRDCVVSSLSTDGSYSVSFIRKHIDNCMIANSLPSTRWCKIIPQKVNIFMWRLLLDRLPHRLNLSSRGLDIDSILCPVCSEHVESNSHTFFSCSAASNIWRLVRGWCELKILTLSSCDEWDIWYTSWKASKVEKDRAYVIFAATSMCEQEAEGSGSVLKRTRTCIHHEREEAEQRLIDNYFGDDETIPKYPEGNFRRRQRYDVVGHLSIRPILMCTSAIRQLAYDIAPNAFDEYLQIYSRKPTSADIEKTYALHEEKHGLPGMLGSIDCMHWEWKNCPKSLHGQFKKRDHKYPTIMLEAAADQKLWI
ncbi:RNA-directed DNA polymerase, eukaryota, reverse transcriptase zinc-binding domain protein [Tanacetum coccineum]